MTGSSTATIDGVTLNASTGQWIVRSDGYVIGEMPTLAGAEALYAQALQANDDAAATVESERFAARLVPAS